MLFTFPSRYWYSSCPALLRIPLCFVSLRIPGYHRLRPNFPDRSPHEMSCNVAVLQPRIRRNGYGLGSSPFARHYWGNHCLFSVPAGTKMFQFPALASIIDGWYLFKVPGCPIRKSADRRSFAPPRGLSQLITSFIASESQYFPRHVHTYIPRCMRDDIYFLLSCVFRKLVYTVACYIMS